MSQCRSCGAPIEWGQYEESGKNAPFDADESETKPGEVRWRLEYDPDLDKMYAVRASVGEVGRLNHFGTCPQSNEWRK